MILQKDLGIYISITNDIKIYSLFDNTSREGLQIEFFVDLLLITYSSI